MRPLTSIAGPSARQRRARGLAAALVAGGAAVFAGHLHAAAPGDEIVVVGERTGPPLWRVVDGDSEVFVLISVPFVPEDLEWDDRIVGPILDEADALTTPIDIDASAGDGARAIGAMFRTFVFNRGRLYMPRGETLADRVGADAAAAFDRARAETDARAAAREALEAAERDEEGESAARATADAFVVPEDAAVEARLAEIETERLHPFFQAGGLIQDAAESAGLVGFEGEVLETVEKRARKAVAEVAPVRSFDLAWRDAKTFLKSIRDLPPETDRVCIEAATRFAQQDLEEIWTRAEAWAAGDVAFLAQTARRRDRFACMRAVSTYLGAMKTFGGVEFWDVDDAGIYADGIVAALDRPGVTVALVPADAWLRPDGVLARLAAQERTVYGPRTDAPAPGALSAGR